VTLLRQVARQLLADSREFNEVMRALDPACQPRRVVIDHVLQTEVCGPREPQAALLASGWRVVLGDLNASQDAGDIRPELDGTLTEF
jgi:hypothetical protein